MTIADINKDNNEDIYPTDIPLVYILTGDMNNDGKLDIIDIISLPVVLV
jgi:hypothetical protein